MKQNNQIGFSDEFSYNNQAIKYEITKDNKLQLYVEDCAFALGLTKKSSLKNSNLSLTVRWDEVYEDLVGIERIPNLVYYKKLETKEKTKLRNEMKEMTYCSNIDCEKFRECERGNWIGKGGDLSFVGFKCEKYDWDNFIEIEGAYNNEI